MASSASNSAHGRRRHAAIRQTRLRDAPVRVEDRSRSSGHRADIVHPALGRLKEPRHGRKRLGDDDRYQQISPAAAPSCDSPGRSRQRQRCVHRRQSRDPHLRIQRQQQRRAIADGRSGGQVAAQRRAVANQRRGKQRQPFVPDRRSAPSTQRRFRSASTRADLHFALRFLEHAQFRQRLQADEIREPPRADSIRPPDRCRRRPGGPRDGPPAAARHRASVAGTRESVALHPRGKLAARAAPERSRKCILRRRPERERGIADGPIARAAAQVAAHRVRIAGPSRPGRYCSANRLITKPGVQ